MDSSLDLGRAIKKFYKNKCKGCPLIDPEQGCVVGECPFDIIMINHDKIIKAYEDVIKAEFFEYDISK